MRATLNYSRSRKPAALSGETRTNLAWQAQTLGALTELKRSLLEPELDRVFDPALKRLVRLAAAEAEALAWQTSYPQLFYPGLLEEKLAEMRRYVTRQADFQRKSRNWFMLMPIASQQAAIVHLMMR